MPATRMLSSRMAICVTVVLIGALMAVALHLQIVRGNRLLGEALDDAGWYSQVVLTVRNAESQVENFKLQRASQNSAMQARYAVFYEFSIAKALSLSLKWENTAVHDQIAELEGDLHEKTDRELDAIQMELSLIANELADFSHIKTDNKYLSNLRTSYYVTIPLYLLLIAMLYFMIRIERAATRKTIEAKRYRLETLGKLAAGHAQGVTSIAIGMKLLLGSKTGVASSVTDKLHEGLDRLTSMSHWMNLASASPKKRPETVATMPWRDIEKSLEEAHTDIKKTFNVQIDANASVIPVPVCIALSELLKNAVVHGGASAVTFHVKQKGPWLEFTVEDNGVGIPRFHADEITEPFFSTKGGEHNGLGLCGVESIVDNFRGRLKFSSPSRKGQGASFVFTIKTDG